MNLVVKGTQIFLETDSVRSNIGFAIQDRLDSEAPFLATLVGKQVNVFSQKAFYSYREETGWEQLTP